MLPTISGQSAQTTVKSEPELSLTQQLEHAFKLLHEPVISGIWILGLGSFINIITDIVNECDSLTNETDKYRVIEKILYENNIAVGSRHEFFIRKTSELPIEGLKIIQMISEYLLNVDEITSLLRPDNPILYLMNEQGIATHFYIRFGRSSEFSAGFYLGYRNPHSLNSAVAEVGILDLQNWITQLSEYDDDFLADKNLHNADLMRIEFSNINLSGTNLSNANLYGSIFNRTIFYNTDLRGANLGEATLFEVDLYGAKIDASTNLVNMRVSLTFWL